MPTTTETRVNDLIINKMSKAQFDALQEKSPTELYIVEGDSNAIYAEQTLALPTAAEGLLGKVYQYIGATDANYTQNYFYKCVSSGSPAVYSWQQVNVQPAVDPLPSQSGNAGKFLTTDGTDASWSDKPLVNNMVGGLGIYGETSSTNGIAIGARNISSIVRAQAANASVAIGDVAKASTRSIAIGASTEASSGSGLQDHSIAIGLGAKTTATGAIQLGGSRTNVTATNSDANTVKIANANGNFEIMSADGTIPEARLADTTGAVQGQVLTLDANGNAVWSNPSSGGPTSVQVTLQGGSANWPSNTQSVTVQGVTTTNTIFAGAAPNSVHDYDTAGIICTAQNTDSLTFECVNIPSNDITVNVLIMA